MRRKMLFAVFCVAALALLVASSKAREARESFAFITDPQLSSGDRIYVRTANDEYLSVCRNCQPVDQNLTNRCSASLCLVVEPTNASVFEYRPLDDGTFALKTSTGKYLKRCANCFERCPNVICADGINPTLQEAKFVLIKTDDGRNGMAIKADTGRLLEINECGQSCGRVLAALGVGQQNNSQFRIEILPPPYQPPVRERQQTKKFLAPSYAPIAIGYTE